MTDIPKSRPRAELASTYIVQDQYNQEEVQRLIVQDQLTTMMMGGVLPEQTDPASLRRVLDVGCGPGGWLRQVAQAYPSIELLVGIDINRSMIQVAREHAETASLTRRLEYHTMDALRMLEFPRHYFSLVNVRFASSFVRTWEWSKLLTEMLRVTYPGAVIRITEAPVGVQSSSPALTRLLALLQQAFFSAGHLFADQPTGLTDTLPDLLSRHGCQEVQTKTYTLTYPAGTPQVQSLVEDMEHLFRTTRPFIEKWLRPGNPYPTLYQQAVEELHAPAFHGSGTLTTVWGTKSLTDGAARRRD